MRRRRTPPWRPPSGPRSPTVPADGSWLRSAMPTMSRRPPRSTPRTSYPCSPTTASSPADRHRRPKTVRVMLAGATPVRSASVSILDDAREGMDTDIRPQDDLFGHVNGRWLAATEIPSDRSSWGPFVQLADICEQQVRDIITDLADGVADGS